MGKLHMDLMYFYLRQVAQQLMRVAAYGSLAG